MTSPQHDQLYQPGGDASEIRAQALLAAFEVGAPLSITDYEDWVSLDWKQPHGSAEAAVRYTVKLVEEGGKELPEAQSQADRIEELGDTLYCGVAALTNCGISLQDIFQNRLGIDQEIELGFIDNLLIKASGPASLQVDTESIEALDSMSIVQQSGVHYAAIDNPAQQFIAVKAGQLGFATIDAFGNATGHREAIDESARDYLSQLGGDLFWAAAHYANSELGSSLLDVVRVNVAKVTGRVLTSTVDHIDGPRTK